MGFPEVHDYEGGKSDWLSRGCAYEGTADLVSRHLTDPVTCALDERLVDVRARVGAAFDGCIVVDGGIAVGVLRAEAADADPGTTALEAMTFGMSTVRPSEEIDELAHRMRHAGAERAIVTDADGRLLGVFSPPD